MMKNPRFLIVLGLILLFSGVIIPFLMVIHMLEPTFPLIFISSGSSTLGLALGMIGLTQYSGESKRRDKNDQF